HRSQAVRDGQVSSVPSVLHTAFLFLVTGTRVGRCCSMSSGEKPSENYFPLMRLFYPKHPLCSVSPTRSGCRRSFLPGCPMVCVHGRWMVVDGPWFANPFV